MTTPDVVRNLGSSESEGKSLGLHTLYPTAREKEGVMEDCGRLVYQGGRGGR